MLLTAEMFSEAFAAEVLRFLNPNCQRGMTEERGREVLALRRAAVTHGEREGGGERDRTARPVARDDGALMVINERGGRRPGLDAPFISERAGAGRENAA